jgi:tetraacyldisaccharide 4'-kinase
VGNIIAGGTGKTPVVRYITELAVESGFKTSVVARGYKRESTGLIEVDDNSTWKEVGDEPLEIYRLTENVRVYIDQTKTIAAQKAFDDGAEVIIIDDGFQHRMLKRDIDLVCLDWRKPFGPGGMLPLGLMREPRKNLKRADMFLFTLYDKQVECGESIELDKSAFYSKVSITKFMDVKSGNMIKADELSNKKVLAFCGLANPIKFENSLKAVEINIVKFVPFRDHHGYSRSEIEYILSEAEKVNADCLITTYKDAVKIESFDFGKFDIYSAMLEISIVDKLENDSRAQFKKALGI